MNKQHPRVTISASVRYEIANGLDRYAEALGVTRSRVVVQCLERGLPLVAADTAARLAEVARPAVDLPAADPPQAA